jgi:small nuclear ribonucleoprotein (snRNP)-like protein
METNPVFEELKRWIGKYVNVRVKYGKKKTQEYKGILKRIDLSWHNGIGNICLEDDRNTYIIRGTYIVSIHLLEPTQEKYNHQ